MFDVAMVFCLFGWVAIYAVFCVCACCAVQYFRNGDFVKCFVCAVVCVFAAWPMVMVGF